MLEYLFMLGRSPDSRISPPEVIASLHDKMPVSRRTAGDLHAAIRRVVTPPCVKGRNNAWFHIIRIKDSELWQQLQKRIINAASEYAGLV